MPQQIRALALLRAGVALTCLLLAACANEPRPQRVSYIAVPHPDDEMQAWSLVEDTPDTYEVFIVMTRGEQTAYCASPGLDDGTGEAAPSPWPAGRWTASCEAARQDSFFDFLAGMAANDASVPAHFSHYGTIGPFDSLGAAICRLDDVGCIEDRTAQVWTAANAAVVWFNLGDGDLTQDEASWAVRTVLENRSALGIDSELPGHQLIGASYWNSTYHDCFVYEHDDHRAVREALWHTDFGIGEQIVATCANDPDASRSAEVSPARFDDAFETSGTERIGAHVVHYGWLASGSPGYWAGDDHNQSELFHRRQTFRVSRPASRPK